MGFWDFYVVWAPGVASTATCDLDVAPEFLQWLDEETLYTRPYVEKSRPCTKQQCQVVGQSVPFLSNNHLDYFRPITATIGLHVGILCVVMPEDLAKPRRNFEAVVLTFSE